MPSLKAYDRTLPYTYAPGAFPALEALRKCPERVERLLIHTQAKADLRDTLTQAAQAHGVRVEAADRALARISGKENCYAAAVVKKTSPPLSADRPHVVLHHPADGGNLGTILRTALGFGIQDMAIIRPGADPFDPHVIRASMGAIFSLHLALYDDMAHYQADHPRHHLYPFMLTGSVPLAQAAQAAQSADVPCTLVFGNEGSGLPDDFSRLGTPVRIPMTNQVDSLNLAVAAAIAMYGFVGSRLEASCCYQAVSTSSGGSAKGVWGATAKPPGAGEKSR